MEIYLVRHTTPKIEKGICYGQTDLDVAETFNSEALKIKNSIDISKKAIVYSSPLQRCTKLAAKFSPSVITDVRLMEMNFGDWEMLKWNELPKIESDYWMNNFVTVATPNGEAYTDLSERATNCFNEITSISANQLLVFTHAGVIRSILSKILNIHLEDSFDITVEYGQIFKITNENNTFTLL